MTVEVMQVFSRQKHPNADTLFVYGMCDKDEEYFTVVANSENIYELDDHVMVAKVGSVLKEGNLYIEESNIRGIVSSGMAIGKTDLPVGTDLTNEYCLSIYHMSWPSIEALYNVKKSLTETNSLRKVTYGAKVKLDGTCSAVQVHPNGDIVFQSRSKIITPEDDNAGFARWGEDRKEYFQSLKALSPTPDKLFIIYGEWCGQGIQKRCSISNIGKKVFCVFAIQYGEDFEVSPKSIAEALALHLGNRDDIYVIPFYQFIEVDYADAEALQKSVDTINQWVADVEKCDPFVKDIFNVEGLGEGLVFYPVPLAKPTVNRAEYAQLVFKAKGEEHKVVKTKQAVQIDPEVAASIDEFVDLFVTENRLNQIAEKVGTFDMKNTGGFLKEFNADVVKESKAELEASKMEWKDVATAVATKARTWWMNKCKTI